MKMKRILVVEDNNMNYLLIEQLLSKFDLTLERAANGKEFYSIIDNSRDFNLILMDLMLPDTDGIELTKYLLNNKIDIPIIFISAYTERCEEIFDLGIEYFISKPINTELFISILGKFVDLQAKEETEFI